MFMFMLKRITNKEEISCENVQFLHPRSQPALSRVALVCGMTSALTLFGHIVSSQRERHAHYLRDSERAPLSAPLLSDSSCATPMSIFNLVALIFQVVKKLVYRLYILHAKRVLPACCRIRQFTVRSNGDGLV